MNDQKTLPKQATAATIDALLKERKGNLKELLAIFDELEPASIEQMLGRWSGFELPTGHTMDGLLELTGWYGKHFISKDEVHPLLFGKGGSFSVNPRLLPMNIPLPRTKALGTIMQLIRPFVQTRKPTARLRMVEYRGKLTATMAYDRKPIMDHFARIDEDTVLGIMDYRAIARPYFFVLQRESTTTS